MKHEVVEPVVAVHDAGQAVVPGAVRKGAGQPVHETVHLGNRRGDGGLVLLAPAPNLPLDVVAGFAVAGQALCCKVHLVQFGHDAVHLVVNVGALRAAHVR